MDKQKIIDKVIKLLALADDNDNPHQAEAAKNKAAELLAMHDLETKDINASKYFVDSQLLNSMKLVPYNSMLLAAICQFCGVQLLSRNGFGHCKAEYRFVGTKPNITAAHYMYDCVLQQRRVKWKQFLALYKREFCRSPSQTMRSNWLRSFANGVHHKLHSISELKEHKIQEYGLVPVEEYKQALAWYKQHHEKIRNGREHKGGGITEGFEAGQSVTINQGVETTATKE